MDRLVDVTNWAPESTAQPSNDPLRLTRFVGPLAGAGTLGASVGLLHFRDPHSSGAYGYCPFHVLTGFWCPGCGGLRAINDLTNGDFVGSLSSNLIALPLLVVAVVALGYWFVARARGRDFVLLNGLKTSHGMVIVGALIVFSIMRNTPYGAWLAP